VEKEKEDEENKIVLIKNLKIKPWQH